MVCHIWLYLDHGLEYIWLCFYGFRVYLDVIGNVWLLLNLTWYVWLYAGGGIEVGDMSGERGGPRYHIWLYAGVGVGQEI